MLRTFSRSSLVLALSFVVAPCSAQSAAEWDSTHVNGVAQKLRCPCGCQLPMSCQMPPHPCPTCKKNRIRIYNMLAAGMSEEQIVARYVAEEGAGVLWTTPGTTGKAAPYVVLLAGCGVVVLVIRRLQWKSEVHARFDQTILEQSRKELAEFDE